MFVFLSARATIFQKSLGESRMPFLSDNVCGLVHWCPVNQFHVPVPLDGVNIEVKYLLVEPILHVLVFTG